MTRIGRQISHFESVDLNSIEAVFSREKICRYRLSLNFSDNLMDQGRHKSAVVILKNPSSADEKMADATIRKVETYIHLNIPDVRTLHILNIFAFRATEPGDLNAAYLSHGPEKVIGPENDHFIRSTIRDCDYILLAWGNNSGIDRSLYEERIFRVKQLLHGISSHKVFIVEGKQKTKHPLHGLMWGYDYKMTPAGVSMSTK